MNKLLKQIELFKEDNKDSKFYYITLFSNVSSLIFQEFKDLNWCGFYFKENNDLVLGPFQGKVACTFIPYKKGVCGKSAYEEKTIIVPNVHEFEGHIACDSASNSEIVLPIFKDNILIAVLDIDSPILNRFNDADIKLLQDIADLLSK